MKYVFGAILVFGIWTGARAMEEEYYVAPHRAERTTAGFTEGGTSNLFPRTSTFYNGLIASTGEFIPEESGYFRIKITPYGAFSGYFVVNDNRVSIRGFFDGQGRAGLAIYRSVWDDCYCYRYWAHVWTVYLDLIPGSDEVEGTVINEWHGWASDLYGLEAGYDSRHPAPQAGRYTLRLPGGADPLVAPPGDGYGAVTVKGKGLVQLKGAMPDGVSISDSAYISVDGWWPLHVSLSNGRGILFGWLQFGGPSPDEVMGDLTWIKPWNYDRTYYPEGFEGTVTVRGGRYTAPSASETPLGWTAGEFVMSAGNLSEPRTNRIQFEGGGRVVDNGGDVSGLRLRVKTKTGLFSGSFQYPGTSRKTGFGGALFQFEDQGGGYFLGINQGGVIGLQPD